jgi:glycosyltransferase involved in cell wall biosynthesis
MRARAVKAENLNVALVHDWLTVPGGSEAVFEQICDLYPGDVFASQIDARGLKFLERHELHPSFLQKMPLSLKKHHLYAPLMPSVYSGMDLSDYDLVLSDSHSFAHGVRRRSDALHINYYHTPARSLWLPEIDNRASKTALHRAIAGSLRKLDLEASKRPDILFANSQTTADRILKFYGRKVSQIIYPPVNVSQYLKVERKSDGEGLLYWGRLIDYKRVDLAIEAAIALGQKLNIVGAGPLAKKLQQRGEGHRNIRFWGRLSEEDLQKLIANSKSLVFPGYEDFGIVPVEALAAGLPVIAFGEGGVVESVTDGMGVLFKEQTVESVVEAIREFDKKSFDSAALKNHAAKFDVSRFREQYKGAVTEAVEQHLKEL